MKASPVINSVSLLSSLRQKRELRWEEDSESCARGGMAKGPGDAGPGGKRTQWWLQDWVFFKIQGLFCERESGFVPGSSCGAVIAMGGWYTEADSRSIER